jgi:predicted DNA-binding protein
MSGKTVRIRKETQNILRELANNEGKPMQTILDLAIEGYRRQRILQEANAA